MYTHDPRQRLKTYIMVVKGGEGRDVLQTRYPFEQVPTEAVKEMEGLGDEVSVTFGTFLSRLRAKASLRSWALSDPKGIRRKSRTTRTNYRVGRIGAVQGFEIGRFLDDNETNAVLLATDRMKNGRVNAELPNDGGMVGSF